MDYYQRGYDAAYDGESRRSTGWAEDQEEQKTEWLRGWDKASAEMNAEDDAANEQERQELQWEQEGFESVLSGAKCGYEEGSRARFMWEHGARLHVEYLCGPVED